MEDRRAVTVDFDHHDPALAVDPLPRYSELRARCPVAWSQAYGGFWILTSYADVWAAARADEDFLSAGPSGITIPRPEGVPFQLPIETDAPYTQKLRRLLSRDFAPDRVATMEPDIYRLGHELIDGFIEAGCCDLITDFGLPLPARFILRCLGFDESMHRDFCHWIHTLVHEHGDPEATIEAAVAIYAEISNQMDQRREGGLGHDMLSVLLRSEIDGQPIADDVVAEYTFLLIFGGLDTSSAALGNALVRLERHPELRRQLLDHPEFIGNAVEEFLRIDSPVLALARTCARDVDVRGIPLAEGDRVLLAWGAANRDPKQFPDPDTIDFGRVENRHLTFGVGLHRCLGSHLGRTMFRIMLELVLQRLPDYTLTEDPEQYRFPDSAYVFALTNLPARFTPGPRR